MDDDEVKAMFTSTLDIANYYDSIRNINKTIEYSFKLCEEDPNDTVGVTKIIYWTSFYKQYDDVFKLLSMIRGNIKKINKAKEIFFRENKISLKQLIATQYINCIKQKELSNNLSNTSISENLEKFYNLMMEWDFYPLYDELVNEQKSITQ